MTPSDVYTLIRNQCDESETTFWGEDEIYQYMSMGESIIAKKLGLIEKSHTTTTSIGVRGGYSAPAGVITRATWDEVSLKCVNHNDIGKIEGEAYGGVTTTGNPRYYYVYGEEINLSPIPASAKTLKTMYRGYPDAVTTASTGWSIPEDYGQHIADFALWRMFLKDQEMKETAIAFKNEWNEGLKDIERDWQQRRDRNMFPVVNEYDPIETFE